ncbi:hypothetical protein Pelo_1932 [Pelomyxa schiedti]|nr:hypothetical protein Pelo_1932 [Pelomyxa schiedti]
MNRTTPDGANRVVWVSHVMWTHVVPWWHTETQSTTTTNPSQGGYATWLLAAGEALWPLVPLACRAAAKLPASATRSAVLRWAAAAGAPSCIKWITAHVPIDYDDEEDEGPEAATGVVNVLFGLCSGGYTDMAKSLVGDGLLPPSPSPLPSLSLSTKWWRDECGLVWPCVGCGERDMVELLRSRTETRSLLWSVCQNGHLETAKWVVDRFRIAEPWECYRSVAAALEGGHLDVAKWLLERFPGCVDAMRVAQWNSLCMSALASCGVEAAEWAAAALPAPCIAECTEAEFPVLVNEENFTCAITAMTRSGRADSEVLRVCEWVHERFPQAWIDIGAVQASRRVLQWAIPTFNFDVTAELVAEIARHCAPYLIRWAVEERHIAVTADLFMDTCANWNAAVSLVKWLADRAPTLSSEQLRISLCSALRFDNMQTASWLEDTFHVLIHLNSDSKSLCSFFLAVCAGSGNENAVKWLLQHLTPSLRHLIPEPVIVEAIKKSWSMQVAMLLRDSFNPNMLNYKWTESDLIVKLHHTVGLPEVKQFVSLLGKELVPKGFVSRFLVGNEFSGHGKATKWLIQEFDLTSAQVKACDNIILFKMISYGDNRSAEWLIHHFDFTLEEVFNMMDTWAKSYRIRSADIETCRMILRCFPSLTAGMIKQHFMRLALASPVTANFMMETFPTEITERFLKMYVTECEYFPPGSDTRIWLGV